MLYWATQLYGLVICPVNWRSSSSDLDFYISDCAAKAVFYDASSSVAVLDSMLADVLFTCEVPVGSVGSHNTKWQNLFEASPVAPPSIAAEDTSIILYTSGTTGRGKGVPRTHRAERAASMAHIAQNSLPMEDIALGVMPLYHTMGIRILLASTLLSGTFVCQSKFSPKKVA